MGDLKRRRSFYEAESSPEVETTGLKSKYTKQARDIVRYALLIQGTGRPVKKRELCETLGIDSSQISFYIDEADRFLREQFCLQLFPLKSMVPGFDKSSPARDEYVLVSKARRNRTLLAKMYPDHCRKDYGIMLFVIIMIVLKDDLVDFEEIYSGLTRSHLCGSQHSLDNNESEVEPENSENSQVKESLRISLARLESMRAFKVETVIDPVSQEKVKKYRIGPYAHSIVDARTLLVLILRLHFPQDKDILHTPEGQEKFKSVRAMLNERIANASFKETL